MKQYLGTFCKCFGLDIKIAMNFLKEQYPESSFTELSILSKEQENIVKNNISMLQDKRDFCTVREMSLKLNISIDKLLAYLKEIGFAKDAMTLLLLKSKVDRGTYNRIQENRQYILSKYYECVTRVAEDLNIHYLLIYYQLKVEYDKIDNVSRFLSESEYQYIVKHKEELQKLTSKFFWIDDLTKTQEISPYVIHLFLKFNESVMGINQIPNSIVFPNTILDVEKKYFIICKYSELEQLQEKIFKKGKEYITKTYPSILLLKNLSVSRDYLVCLLRNIGYEPSFDYTLEQLYYLKEIYTLKEDFAKASIVKDAICNISSREVEILRFKYENLVLQGQLCPYCGGSDFVGYVDVDEDGRLECSCGASVTIRKGLPLGRLADEQLRALRIEFHEHFDSIISLKKIKKDALYRILSKKMNIPYLRTHAAKFDNRQCMQAIEILKEILSELSTK